MASARHILLAAALVGAAALAAAAAEPTQAQWDALAARAAQADALRNLTQLVWASHVTQGKTVAEALAPGSDGDIRLRVALRAARMVGQPRRYSDGVTEADLEIAASAVVQAVSDVCTGGDRAKVWLEDLKARGEEGLLRVSGRARVPDDAGPDVAVAAAAAPPDEPAALYPIGWEGVTAAGRVEAQRAARVRAYEAMGARIRALPLRSAETVGKMGVGSPAAEGRLDVFLRSLPVAGPPRLMPDRVAEVTVAASVRDLIQVLKEVRALAPGGDRWRDDDIDQVSVLLKTDRLEAVGCGMPPPASVRAAQPEGPGRSAPLPDWAAQALEATGAAALSDEITDRDRARVLAARSAKARALADLESRLGAVKLDDGRTVADRAAKEEVFRNDVAAFLASARTASSRRADDGRWEVTLRLPLLRLYEFSRRAAPGP